MMIYYIINNHQQINDKVLVSRSVARNLDNIIRVWSIPSESGSFHLNQEFENEHVIYRLRRPCLYGNSLVACNRSEIILWQMEESQFSGELKQIIQKF